MAVNLHNSPAFLIARLSHLLRVQIGDVLREQGLSLSPEEYAVLMVLSTERQSRRLRDLANMLMRDPSTVKRQLVRLLDEGLVLQSPDPDDGRGVLLTASPAGYRASRKVAPAVERLQESAMAGISSDDQQTMVQALQRMHQNLMELG